ncbi:uncharacterized protein LOC143360078 [Halictus rubicundus]|uniref:uncharacterized protein LOC143360078 n=1 Tax=Halictus rubicundus TaxID=77578 RepID=UPI0040355C73
MTVLKPLDTGLLYNPNQSSPPRGARSPGSPATPVEMPDLESIIRDFEMGYLSPSKKGAPKTVDTPKQQPKNFVKKIVAAFEVKYKVYNELKTAQEARDAEETSNMIESSETKRKSGLFSSPFRSGSEEFRNSSKTYDTPKKTPEKSSRRSGGFSTPSKYSAEDSKAFRRSGLYGSPLKFFEDEGTCQDPADESKDTEEDESMISTPSKKSFSPCNRSKESIQSDIYSSPVRFESRDSKNSSGFDQEESGRGSNVPWSPLDDTNTLESIDLDVTLPEPDETILLDSHALCKTSTTIDEYNRSEEKSLLDPPPAFRNDKTPKIIGAFLKKPIEVEDTSIEWIPITGKKLPRKKSLKKLLTSWTTKRYFDKKNTLFSSERNLCEETRELQDSGYDERSSCSSSSTSLISITEALLHQENSYVELSRTTPTFKTFRPRSSHNAPDGEAVQDAHRSASKQKLVLTEVPREQLKVDLAPTYPCPKVVTMSLGRKAPVAKKSPISPDATTTTTKAALPRIPKHPHLSSIPKHPFVALTKLDEPEYEKESVIIKNNLYEVEFRRSCTDINSANAFSCSSSSSESIYDVPRRYLSKSETQIPDACRVEFRKPRVPIYDIPRRRCQGKSHVYEDTLAKRKKRARCGEQQPLSEYYSSPSDTEPHYATVKPIYHSREMLLSSAEDIASARNVYPF